MKKKILQEQNKKEIKFLFFVNINHKYFKKINKKVNSHKLVVKQKG